MALPSFPPPGPFVLPAYVFRLNSAWLDSVAVGSETWKRLARWAVRWVSDWRCAGREGREVVEWAPLGAGGWGWRDMMRVGECALGVARWAW